MGAPLLLSFDVAHMDHSQRELYGNPEIVAVNQDADSNGRGTLGGRRVSGGDFVQAAAPAWPQGVGDASVLAARALSSADLAAVDARVVQKIGDTATSPGAARAAPSTFTSTFTSTANRGCGAATFPSSRVGVESMGLVCTNATTADACIAACCAEGVGCDTWQWNPGYGPSPTSCTHAHGGGVYGPCWTGKETSIAQSKAGWSGGSKRQTPPPHPSPPPPPPPPNTASLLNVWARNLHDGSTAIIFVNNGAAAATMTCDAGCAAAAGLAAGRSYGCRDLFARTDLANITVGPQGFSSPSAVPGDAGSILLRLSPV
jgi:hypothetical protein